MTFELPNLDVMNAQQVLDQLVRRVPGYSPAWTDHNASDPGVTLLQMLVWICEGTAYTADAVPLETYRNMLRWVVGLSSAVALPGTSDYATDFPYATYADNTAQDPAYESLKNTLVQVEIGAPLGYTALHEAVVAYRKAPFLAITPNDLSALTKEISAFIDAQALQGQTSLHVARLCLNQRGDVTDLFLVNDGAYSYSPPNDDGSGAFSVVLTSPLDDPTSQAEVALLQAVRQYLAARTLLGSAIAIRHAHLCYLEVQCTVRCFARERADQVATAVLTTLEQALQPAREDGGHDWAYGRQVDAAALMPVIASVSGVDRVENLTIGAFRPPVVLMRRRQAAAAADAEMSRLADQDQDAGTARRHRADEGPRQEGDIGQRRNPHPLPVIDAGLPRLYCASVTALEADNG